MKCRLCKREAEYIEDYGICTECLHDIVYVMIGAIFGFIFGLVLDNAKWFMVMK